MMRWYQAHHKSEHAKSLKANLAADINARRDMEDEKYKYARLRERVRNT